MFVTHRTEELLAFCQAQDQNNIWRRPTWLAGNLLVSTRTRQVCMNLLLKVFLCHEHSSKGQRTAVWWRKYRSASVWLKTKSYSSLSLAGTFTSLSTPFHLACNLKTQEMLSCNAVACPISVIPEGEPFAFLDVCGLWCPRLLPSRSIDSCNQGT